jgi:flagellar biogenesis protein FliO
MQVQAHAQAANPVMQFVRAAFERVKRPALWKRRRELRVCETLSLGNRNFVAVVGYQDQRFLVAGTANSISLLADVTREPVPGIDREERELAAD